MRRRLLVAAVAAVLVLAGCSSGDPQTADAGDATAPAAAPGAGPTQKAVPQPEPKPKPGKRRKPRPAATPTTPATPAGVEAVELARSPRELAQILTLAETTIRDERINGLPLAQAAHTQQRVYRRLSLQPEWRDRVVRHLPPNLRPIARKNLHAGSSLTSLVTPQEKLPDWRILRPPPPAKLLRAYRRAAAKFNLEWEYLAAINLVETRMGRIRGTSTAGAQGPMQFMPATWDAYGRGDIDDPEDAITAAARYLAAGGAPADMPGALWSYNHSDRYVDAVTDYAEVMMADPRAYRGYYHWQVYYVTRDGDVHLPEGYGT